MLLAAFGDQTSAVLVYDTWIPPVANAPGAPNAFLPRREDGPLGHRLAGPLRLSG
jgi:hypothetical protein